VVVAVVAALALGVLVLRGTVQDRAGPDTPDRPEQQSDAPVRSAGPRPGPDTTGVPTGTALTPATGGIRVTEPGTVIDALDLRGSVVVAAPDVVIRRSRIVGTPESPYGVFVESGSVAIYDSEITGFANGIAQDNWSAHRVDLHGMAEDGVKLGSNVTLESSWIHDLTPEPGAHADGAQMQTGVRNVIVRNNVIDATVDGGPGGNSAIFLAPDLGPSTEGPVLVRDNYLDGGNYVLYCVDGADGQYTVGNVTIRSNRFGRNFRDGPASVNVPIAEAANVWADTAEPLALTG
jgi:hypothetical protein